MQQIAGLDIRTLNMSAAVKTTPEAPSLIQPRLSASQELSTVDNIGQTSNS